MNVRLVINIEAQPGLGALQVNAFTELAPIVRAEKGCVQYDLHQVEGNPDKFVLLELWSSPEALAAHDITAHMVAADRSNAAFRARPATVTRLRPLSLS